MLKYVIIYLICIRWNPYLIIQVKNGGIYNAKEDFDDCNNSFYTTFIEPEIKRYNVEAIDEAL